MGISLAGALVLATTTLAQSTSLTPQLNIWAELADQPAPDVYQIDVMMTLERVNFGSADFVIDLDGLTLADRPEIGIEPIWYAENERVPTTFGRGCGQDPYCFWRPRWEFNEATQVSDDRLEISVGVKEGLRGPDSNFTGEVVIRFEPEVDSQAFLAELGLEYRPFSRNPNPTGIFATVFIVTVPGDLETASTLLAQQLDADERTVWAEPNNLIFGDRRVRSGRDGPVRLGSLFVELDGLTPGHIDIIGLDWQRNLDGVITPIYAPFVTTGLTVPAPASLVILLPGSILALRRR